MTRVIPTGDGIKKLPEVLTSPQRPVSTRDEQPPAAPYRKYPPDPPAIRAVWLIIVMLVVFVLVALFQRAW